jgi:hypothetical protein
LPPIRANVAATRSGLFLENESPQDGSHESIRCHRIIKKRRAEMASEIKQTHEDWSPQFTGGSMTSD